MRRTVSRSTQTNVIAQDARGASLLVADAVLRTLERGHWSSNDPARAEVETTARRTLEIDARMGPVCDADLASAGIAAMAEGAHALIMAARAACGRGQALIWCDDDTILVDPKVEEAVVLGYSIIALG